MNLLDQGFAAAFAETLLLRLIQLYVIPAAIGFNRPYWQACGDTDVRIAVTPDPQLAHFFFLHFVHIATLFLKAIQWPPLGSSRERQNRMAKVKKPARMVAAGLTGLSC
jgi:hypothetical protein